MSGKSLRQRYAQHKKLGHSGLENPKIGAVELAISNDCNLMCECG